MASKRPDRRLMLKKFWPRGVGVYQITDLDDGDTVEFADFDPDIAIESATIIDAEDGSTITQGAIANNVLTVNDAGVTNDRCWFFVVGTLVQ